MNFSIFATLFASPIILFKAELRYSSYILSRSLWSSDDKNFITMRSRVVFTDSNVVKETGIVVYIICNEHQIDLLQGSRADLLADEVDRILNNGDKPLFGLGGIKLSTADEVQFNEGYSGWSIPSGRRSRATVGGGGLRRRPLRRATSPAAGTTRVRERSTG